ncbi:MAG: hypothetical protein LUQ38_10720 [Methanotrichaceae archaeon]|nr:hypothetical protein [Methanotrichaceae archaeon]
MEDEENLKKITKLLEQGCTMLATHHSCGAPLFRCKGQVICPICSSPQEGNVEAGKILSASDAGQEFVTLSLSSKAEKKESHENALGSIPKQIDNIEEIGRTKNALRVALMHKLKDLQKRMEEEEDLDRLSRLLQCMEGILKILKILE